MEADVVGTPLELGGAKRARFQDAGLFEDTPDLGDVLFHQLFLEVDGVGGHDDALAVGGGVHHGRQEISDALADTGAALDDQLSALIDGAGDGLEHLSLLGTRLEIGEGFGEDSVGVKQAFDLLLGERTADDLGRRAVVGIG